MEDLGFKLRSESKAFILNHQTTCPELLEPTDGNSNNLPSVSSSLARIFYLCHCLLPPFLFPAEASLSSYYSRGKHTGFDVKKKSDLNSNTEYDEPIVCSPHFPHQ